MDVEETHSSVEALSPHTDWPSLEQPARVICIACVRADPLYPEGGANAVFDLRDAELRLRARGLWQRLATTTFPFPVLGGDVAPRTILTELAATHTFGSPRFMLRYYARRILRGFMLSGTEPSQAQSEVLAGFEDAISPIRVDVTLGSGELLFVDNFIALHSRARTSVALADGGELRGRKVFVLYVTR
jgi:hypothetical protein